MNYMEVRQQLYGVVQKGVAAGLIRASAGNFSLRTPDGYVAITPTSIKYDQLKPEEIAIVDLDGNHIDGPCKASSETPMHTTILRSLPEVGAVCHTHSPFAMTFAVVGQEIPMVNTELLVCGAPIPVAAWACPGSAAGGEVTVDIFKVRPELKVVLLRNHGAVSIGEDINHAFEYAYDVEIAAQVYYQALQVGQPIVITKAQVQEIFDIYSAK
jgi:L-fuculose-phosphate aldolase